MELWGFALCAALVLVVIILIIKVHTLQKSIDEISSAFSQKLEVDTNTLISISGRDPHALALASSINTQLRRLRSQRRKYQQGDAELKEAVTNISHDLRTPLTAICGYMDLLCREEKSPDAERYLDMISNRVQVLKELTEELFRYSVIASVEDGKTELLSLNGALEESLAAAYGAFYKKHMTPVITIPDGKVERLLNRSSLSRIFSNIISNALKYSDGDFAVRMDLSGTIVFSNASRDMTPVMAGRLFDRFYTVETGRNSTGLGLSIAKVLTERMGGAISADCINGRLNITVFFPAESAGA